VGGRGFRGIGGHDLMFREGKTFALEDKVPELVRGMGMDGRIWEQRI
jgi:hypothetical protein